MINVYKKLKTLLEINILSYRVTTNPNTCSKYSIALLLTMIGNKTFHTQRNSTL